MSLAAESTNFAAIRANYHRFALGALVVTFLALAGAGVYIAYSHMESQRSEIEVLVRELASTRLDRDDLQRKSTDLAGSLAAANDRISSLSSALDLAQTGLDSAYADVRRLEDESATLRDRLQVARTETRDAASAAEIQRTAREREARLSRAALDYADAGAALSKTRDRMIDVSREQIAAERAGRTATANLLVSEYNTLLGTHNRQVTAANAALSRLRSLL